MRENEMDIKNADLNAAYEGSYYTILGTGGDLKEWVEGYEEQLDKAGIGKPTEWFQTTGTAINAYTEPSREHDRFHPELSVLMFPLKGMDPTKLALFKLQMEDRWFDDIVDNIRR